MKGSSIMKPTIDQTTFGSITIEGQVFNHDVLIRPEGEIKKRKKKLSKEIYGTSHILSLAEAKYIYQSGMQRLIIGSGQYGNVQLSEDASNYFHRQHCEISLFPTPDAIRVWNDAQGPAGGLFHVTC
jgi:hypothetical protein